MSPVSGIMRRVYRSLLWLWGRLPIPNPLRWALVWATHPKFLVGVAVVVLNEHGEVLLFKHTYRRKWPWGLPSGLLERGEDAARAAEREVLEESGLVVRVLRPLEVITDRRSPEIDLVFLGCLEGGAFQPSAEVSEVGFFPISALPPLWAEQDAVIRKAAAEGLLAHENRPAEQETLKRG